MKSLSHFQSIKPRKEAAWVKLSGDKLPAKCRVSCGKRWQEVSNSGHTKKTASLRAVPALSQGDRQKGNRDPHTRPCLQPPARAMRKGEPEKPTSLGQPTKTSRMAPVLYVQVIRLDGACLPTLSTAFRMMVWVTMVFTAVELGGL